MPDNFANLLPLVSSVDDLVGNKTVDGVTSTVRVPRANITNGASPADIIAVADRATALEGDLAPGARAMRGGANIASASTINLGAATGDFAAVTGTATISALGTAPAGIERTVYFTGVLILTHSGTLVLPTGANITTAVGDVAIFRSHGGGAWRCVSFLRATGVSVGLNKAASATVITGTDDSQYVTSAGDKAALEARVGPLDIKTSYVTIVTDDRFAYGKRLISVETDSNDVGYRFNTDDGYLRSKLALNGGATITVAWDDIAGENVIAINPAAIDVPDQSAIWFHMGRQLDRADVDANLYLTRGMLVDGTQVDGKAGATASSSAPVLASAVVAPSHIVEVLDDGSGMAQIYKRSRAGGIRTALTTSGPNGVPALLPDGDTILYPSTRSGSRTLYAQSILTGGEVLAESGPELVGFGNSLMDPGFLPSLTPLGYTVDIEGRSGQRDDHIAARMGAVPVTLVVSGNTIPTSGNVAVSSITPDIFDHLDVDCSFRIEVLGAAGEVIPGKLTKVFSTGVIGFTRYFAGDAVTVPNPATMRVISGKGEGTLDPSAALSLDVLRRRTALLYPNFNSITIVDGSYPTSAIIARNAAMVAALLPVIKRFAWIGDVCGYSRLTAAQAGGSYAGTIPADDVASQVLIERTIAINEANRAAWGPNYFDQTAYMKSRGYTTVKTVNGVAYDIVLPSILTDGVHHGTLGKTEIARGIDLHLKSLYGA
ncbi:hypothetical protein SAMN02745157_1541 [Kaistia soli DSM 19436]|uniref:Uncharacterized protein n=1 Tax=Kaistia soli DSM 19436 TaxID=1122133 RepID=A0A1M4YKH4_9HYPH|nr:hypothetical protein [Kaistia soli]SHF06002.1 hypothetical protein SAMN02745157_1541 [Kaistia soli DSM 19436]